MGELPTPPANISAIGGAGLGGGLGIVLSHVIRDKIAEGESEAAKKRELLAAQFEALTSNPQFNSDPNITAAAQQHAMRLRTLGAHERLPKEYLPDPKTGWIPAYQELVLKAHQNAQNAPPPQMAEPPATGPTDFDGLFPAEGGPRGADRGLPPIPGGRKLGPNAISPAPAVGGMPAPPAPIDHPGLPPGMESAGLSPIAIARQQKAVSDIGTHVSLTPDAAGEYDPKALPFIKGQIDRKAKAELELRKKGMAGQYDDSGNLTGTRSLKPEEMSPVESQRSAYLKAHEQLFEAQTEFKQLQSAGLKPGTPQYDFNERKLRMQEARANSYSAAVQIAGHNSQRADQVFTRDTFGWTAGPNGEHVPVPGAMVDPETGQTFGLKTPGTKLAEPTVLARNKADQGRVIISQGNALIRDIQAHADELGAWDGRINQGEVGFGIADPVVRDIFTRLKSYAALQPQLHGARGLGYQQEFETAVGHLKDNPDSVIASINALNSLGGEFVQSVASRPMAHAGGPAPTNQQHEVNRSEWDALIKKGHTPADLKASGIVLKKP